MMNRAHFLVLLVVAATINQAYTCDLPGTTALAACGIKFGLALQQAGTDKSKYCPAFNAYKTCVGKVSGCTSSEIQMAIKAIADQLKTKFGVTCGGCMTKVSLLSILIAFVVSRFSS